MTEMPFNGHTFHTTDPDAAVTRTPRAVHNHADDTMTLTFKREDWETIGFALRHNTLGQADSTATASLCETIADCLQDWDDTYPDDDAAFARMAAPCPHYDKTGRRISCTESGEH